MNRLREVYGWEFYYVYSTLSGKLGTRPIRIACYCDECHGVGQGLTSELIK